MKVEINWRTELPTPKNYNQTVIVTLYDKKENYHWVEFAYIDVLGNFKSVYHNELKHPVVAWACKPYPYMTNPF